MPCARGQTMQRQAQVPVVDRRNGKAQHRDFREAGGQQGLAVLTGSVSASARLKQPDSMQNLSCLSVYHLKHKNRSTGLECKLHLGDDCQNTSLSAV